MTKKRLQKNKKVSKFKSGFVAHDNDLIRLIEPDIIHNLAKKMHYEDKSGKKLRKTKRDVFYYTLFTCVIEIDYKMQDISLCPLFIKNYNVSSQIKSMISRYDYIMYHLEFYYINIVSIFDRMLHLVNFLYDLGLKDRFVNRDIIVTNKNVDKNIIKLLKRFDKSLQGIRTLQNKIKHKERINEREKNKWIKDAELFEHVDSMKFLETGEKSEFLAYAKTNYAFYIKEKKKELLKNNKVLTEALNNFYNELMPQIKKRTNRFK